MPVWAAYDPRGPAVDPWGTPYELLPGGDPGRFPYSCGPNRVDEQGSGDDVLVFLGRDWRVLFHRVGTEAMFAVAVALAFCWELVRLFGHMMRAARGSLTDELQRAALLAIGPTLALIVAVLLASSLFGLRAELAALGEGLLVSLEVALPASIYLAVFATLLGFRLRGRGE